MQRSSSWSINLMHILRCQTRSVLRVGRDARSYRAPTEVTRRWLPTPNQQTHMQPQRDDTVTDTDTATITSVIEKFNADTVVDSSHAYRYATALSDIADTNNESKLRVIGQSGAINVILNTTQSHLSSTDVAQITLILRALLRLISIEHNQARLVRGDGIEIVVDVMNQHLNDPIILEVSSSILREVLSGSNNSDVNIQRFLSANGVPTVIDCIKQHKDNSIIFQHICILLAFASFIDTALWRSRMFDADMLTVTIDGIRRFMDAEKTVSAACSLLGAAAGHSVVFPIKADIGMVVTALKRYSDDNTIVRNCLRVFLSLTFDMTTIHQFDSDAVRTIVDVSRHSSVPIESAILCLETLRNLCCKTRVTRIIVNTDGIDVVLSIMRRHSTSDQVFLPGYTVLQRFITRLEHDSDGRSELTVDEENHVLIADAGGIEVVIAGLNQTFEAEVDLQALMLLSILVQGDCYVRAYQSGCVEAILRSMHRHSDHLLVQRWGCWALSVFLSPSTDAVLKESMMTDIVRLAGINIVVSAIRRFTDEKELIDMALTILYDIIEDNADRSDSAVLAGGIDAVITTLKRHSLETDIQSYGLAILETVIESIQSDVDFEYVVNAGVIQVAVGGMRAHIDEERIQSFAIGFLFCLASLDDNILLLIVEAGGVDVIIASMTRNIGSRDVQMKGIPTIAALSWKCEPSTCEVIRAAITHSANAHSDDNDIQKSYQIALEWLHQE